MTVGQALCQWNYTRSSRCAVTSSSSPSKPQFSHLEYGLVYAIEKLISNVLVTLIPDSHRGYEHPHFPLVGYKKMAPCSNSLKPLGGVLDKRTVFIKRMGEAMARFQERALKSL